MTDLPTQATLTGTLEADSSHTPTPRGAPVCRCQKYQRIAAAHTERDSLAANPADTPTVRLLRLAAHLERHHPEIQGVLMSAEEAEYRGILGL